MTKKKWKLNDNRIYFLTFSLLVIICGIWYTNYKNKIDFVFSQTTIINEKSVYNLNNAENEQNNSFNEDSDKAEKTNEDLTEALININKANEDTLEMLPGIGEAIAGNIIKYRRENGDFKTIEDIKNVPKIGDKTFEKIKGKITVE